MGNQNNIVKIGVPGFLAVPVFRGAGVFRSVPECFGVPVFRCSGVPVFRCSGVPVFLVLVHVILLTIFDNA